MKATDIIKVVKNKLKDATVLEIIDEINNFYSDDGLEVKFNYQYIIELYYSGTATASAAIMTDSIAAFATDGTLIGQTIYNVTDGSSGTITAATATAITATLSGGSNNAWVLGDSYTISLTNNIHIPKNINRINSVNLGSERIWGSISEMRMLNSSGSTYDPYTNTPFTPSGLVQSVAIRDGYILTFQTDIAVTENLIIYCEKINDELTYANIAVELTLPDKFKMPIAYYVLKELYGSDKYYSRQKEMDYEYRFNKRIRSAKKDISIEQLTNSQTKVNSELTHGSVLS